MRMLTKHELDLVAGGTTSSDDEIVVTGYRMRYSLEQLAWYSGVYETPGGGGGGGGESPEPEPADTDSIDVTVNIPGELTEQQKAAVEALKTAIAAATEKINALPDNAKITLPNGAIVTGAELKAAWAATDFVINPQGYNGYANGSARGESAYNGGNPQVSFNIDLVTGYAQHGAAGLNYLVLHEVGHLTAANRAFDENANNSQAAVERMANDIARAIAHAGGLQMLPATGLASPEYGYSTPDPLVFQTTSSGDGTGGGGGGGGDNGELTSK